MTDLEISDALRQKVGNYSKISLEIADASVLPFSDKEFNCVVMSLVFYTVPNVKQGMREIRMVLKDNGCLIYIEHLLHMENLLVSLLVKLWILLILYGEK